MKTVAHFRDPQIAHVARGLLESESIAAVVMDEHLVQANWVLSQAIGGVKVAVPDEDLDRAREVLSGEYGDNGTEPEAMHLVDPDELCPVCGSGYITQNNYSLLSLIPSILLQLPFFFRRRKWACKSCTARW